MPTDGVEKMFATPRIVIEPCPGAPSSLKSTPGPSSRTPHRQAGLGWAPASRRGESARGIPGRIAARDGRRYVLDFLGTARGRDDDFLDGDLFGGLGWGPPPPRHPPPPAIGHPPPP